MKKEEVEKIINSDAPDSVKWRAIRGKRVYLEVKTIKRRRIGFSFKRGFYIIPAKKVIMFKD